MEDPRKPVREKLKAIYPRLEKEDIVAVTFLCVRKYNLDLSIPSSWERLADYLFPGDLQDRSLFPAWVLEEEILPFQTQDVSASKMK